MTTKANGKKKQGFAVMDPDRVREIASQGGRMCHMKGTGHEWTSEEAAAAGRKGAAARMANMKKLSG